MLQDCPQTQNKNETRAWEQDKDVRLTQNLLVHGVLQGWHWGRRALLAAEGALWGLGLPSPHCTSAPSSLQTAHTTIKCQMSDTYTNVTTDNLQMRCLQSLTDSAVLRNNMLT